MTRLNEASVMSTLYDDIIEFEKETGRDWVGIQYENGNVSILDHTSIAIVVMSNKQKYIQIRIGYQDGNKQYPFFINIPIK